MQDFIEVKGSKQHNLKNLTLKFPKNKLVVFTGVSGSGKSSMAYDTIFAEGQRRYVESLSAYARQFLGVMNKPDVESITGLSPSISIDQKKSGHNPRSTVGTITEIYDYLRLLYARVGHPHCPICGKEISKQSPQQISEKIFTLITKKAKTSLVSRHMILSPTVRDRKGEFSGLLSNLQAKGFQRARIDSKVFDLDEDLLLIKTNKHTIEVIIDRISFSKKLAADKISSANLRTRVSAAVEQALELSDGLVIAVEVKDKGLYFPEKPQKFVDNLFSEHFSCPIDNLNLTELEPRTFSFNSPHGACQKCNGLGSLLKVTPELVVNPSLSISQGALLPFSRVIMKETWFKRTVYTVLNEYNESPDTAWKHLPTSLKDLILFGDQTTSFTVFGTNRFGKQTNIETVFEGIVPMLNRRYKESTSDVIRTEIEKYTKKETCSECHGKRLKKEALAVTIDDLNIIDVTTQQISSALNWVEKLLDKVSEREKTIASPIIKELLARLTFLKSVGLEYLTLDRSATTLAGGESQRIRLASQIGSGLSGVLYVLDEPTVGLHQRDNKKLIKTLKNLRDLGNSVVVVEHDRETIENADWVVDFGPGAGKQGGNIVAQGNVQSIKKSRKSLTGNFLSGKKKVHIKKNLSKKNKIEGERIELTGCKQHNLKNIDITFPLGKFICVSGVSGSGKSTLVHDIFFHALKRELNFLYRVTPGKFENIKGAGAINRVSLIDQSPIGKTPRSNPATYTKAFDYIRKAFSHTKESAIRGYKPGRFSFNVKGGRCEACRGAGSVKIEMQFLPDVYVTCEVCHGTRFNRETRDIRYKGKTIDEILRMSVNEALDFFSNVPGLKTKLETLSEVGLEYIELGQPATTLSGGEAQRIKISKELSVRSAGHTVYLLDEPTTGLHFADLEKLLVVLRKLVANNNTVVVIEHNLDVLANADHIIDLGPEGGERGGRIVAQGSPREIIKVKKSYTGRSLKKLLK